MDRRTPFARRHTARAAAALVALTAAGAAPGQPAPALPAVQQVEVIAVTPVSGLDVPKERMPANVQTATGAEIERSHALDLADFLQRRLGSVFVNEMQGNPLQADLNFRGFTASPVLGTAQGLSIYLDGVRLNQPFGDVVSWDLIPTPAIASMALMPGSNPLFGLNTLGGAVSVQTKDGRRHPGSAVQVSGGSHGRAALQFEHGGADESLDWYVTGRHFQEQGWREASHSDAGQLFGKLGRTLGDGRVWLSAAFADTELNGTALQEARLLSSDWRSVYTRPDTTRNRSALLTLGGHQALAGGSTLAGQAWWRRIRTSTLNGDVNAESLGQNVYVPGETAAITPFPSARCLAEAAAGGEPAEKCTGVINRSSTTQTHAGATLQLSGDDRWGALAHQWLAGAAFDASRVQFTQASELGFLNPDRSITGIGVFGDGAGGGTIDGQPYDTRVDLSARTRTASVFASDVIALDARTHLTIAARFNRTTIESRDAITPGGGPGSLDGDHAYSRLNPALGLTFAATPSLTLYGGVNQGSRAPSAVELGCADPANPCKLPNAMAGDPPLAQVVTTTVEAGVRGRTGGTSWNVGVFRADNRDDILFVADDASGFGYFRNFGRTRRQGLEAGLSARAGPVALTAQYTWLDATFQSPETVNGAGNSQNDQALAGFPGVDGTIAVRPGDRIPLVPRQLLKLGAAWTVGPALSVSADLQAVAGSPARGNENGAHQPDGVYYLGSGRNAGHAVMNLGVEGRPAPALTAWLQVRNLFDRRYASAAQLGPTAFDAAGRFVARPFPPSANGDRPLVGSTFYAPGAPRSVELGLRWAFGG